jgi:hypothetical protein
MNILLKEKARNIDPTTLSARAREELNNLREELGGTLRPIDLVNFARDPKTALHTYFDWDDSLAAEKWRLHQARMFINVKFSTIQSESKTYRVKTFTSLKEDRGKVSYRYTIDVLGDPVKRESMLEQAKLELKSIKKRYEVLHELASIWDAIDLVVKE